MTTNQTMAEKIWNDIKDRTISIFGLPGQTTAKYCSPIIVEPSKLYLNFTVGAALPALEEAFGKAYEVELVDRYITLAPKKG